MSRVSSILRTTYLSSGGPKRKSSAWDFLKFEHSVIFPKEKFSLISVDVGRELTSVIFTKKIDFK